MGGAELLVVALVLLCVSLGIMIADRRRQPPRRERDEVKRRLQGED